MKLIQEEIDKDKKKLQGGQYLNCKLSFDEAKGKQSTCKCNKLCDEDIEYHIFKKNRKRRVFC